MGPDAKKKRNQKKKLKQKQKKAAARASENSFTENTDALNAAAAESPSERSNEQSNQSTEDVNATHHANDDEGKAESSQGLIVKDSPLEASTESANANQTLDYEPEATAEIVQSQMKTSDEPENNLADQESVPMNLNTNDFHEKDQLPITNSSSQIDDNTTFEEGVDQDNGEAAESKLSNLGITISEPSAGVTTEGDNTESVKNEVNDLEAEEISTQDPDRQRDNVINSNATEVLDDELYSSKPSASLSNPSELSVDHAEIVMEEEDISNVPLVLEGGDEDPFITSENKDGDLNSTVTEELVNIQHDDQSLAEKDDMYSTEDQLNNQMAPSGDQAASSEAISSHISSHDVSVDQLSSKHIQQSDEHSPQNALFETNESDEMMPWESNDNSSHIDNIVLETNIHQDLDSGDGNLFDEKDQHEKMPWETAIEPTTDDHHSDNIILEDNSVIHNANDNNRDEVPTQKDNEAHEYQLIDKQEENSLFQDECNEEGEPLPWETTKASEVAGTPTMLQTLEETPHENNDREKLIEKKFSFLENDDDFLDEDDDSFLGSDEEFPIAQDTSSIQSRPKATSQDHTKRYQPSTSSDVSGSISNPIYSGVATYPATQPVANIIGNTAISEAKEVRSKYAPSFGSQQREPSIHSVGTPVIVNSTVPNQPQPFIQPVKQDPTIFKKLDEEKKKSDAYDLPFEVVMRKPTKIAHAKPFGVSTSNINSRSSSGSLSSAQFNPGQAGRTPSTSTSHGQPNQQQTIPAAVPVKQNRAPPVKLSHFPTPAVNDATAPVNSSSLNPQFPGSGNQAPVSQTESVRTNPYAPVNIHPEGKDHQLHSGSATIAHNNAPPSSKRYAPITSSHEPPKMVKSGPPYSGQSLRARAFSNVSNGSAGSLGSQTSAKYGFPQLSQPQRPHVANALNQVGPGDGVPALSSLKVYGLPITNQPVLSPNTQRRTHARSNSSVYAPAHASKYAPTVQPQYHEPYVPVMDSTVSNFPTQMVGDSQIGPRAGLNVNPYRDDARTPQIDNSSLLQRQFPIFHWGKSSKVVYALPPSPESGIYITSNVVPSVNVVGYDMILKAPLVLKSFAGPLVRHKTKRKEVIKWIDDLIEQLSREQPLEDLTMWQIFKALLADNISTKEIANILYNSDELLPYLSQPIRTNRKELNAHKLDENSRLKILAFLQTGRHEEALELALSERDFALALMLSSMSGKEKWSQVVDAYLREEFSTAHSNGDSPVNLLTLIFQVFVGNAKKVIQDIESDQSKLMWALQNWKMILSAVLNNADGYSKEAPSDNVLLLPSVVLEFLVRFGVFLIERGVLLGGALAFIVANVPMSTSDKILDSTVAFQSFGNPTSVESILYSELYEYTFRTNDPKFTGFECLLPLKMAHASLLADYGLASYASKYTDMLAASIRSLPKNTLTAMRLASQLNSLTSRLLGSNGGWLGKPKLSNVWGQLDKSFNRFIGGDDDEVLNKSAEKTVFDSFTPSSSRNASMVDLSQQSAGIGVMGGAITATGQLGQVAFGQERAANYLPNSVGMQMQAVSGITSTSSSKRPSIGGGRATSQKFVPQGVNASNFAKSSPSGFTTTSPMKIANGAMNSQDNLTTDSSIPASRNYPVPSATTPPPLFSKKLRSRHTIPTFEKVGSLDELYNLGSTSKSSAAKKTYEQMASGNDLISSPHIPAVNSRQSSRKGSRRNSLQSTGSNGTTSILSSSPRGPKHVAILSGNSVSQQASSIENNTSPSQKNSLNKNFSENPGNVIPSFSSPPTSHNTISEIINEEIETSSLPENSDEVSDPVDLNFQEETTDNNGAKQDIVETSENEEKISDWDPSSHQANLSPNYRLSAEVIDSVPIADGAFEKNVQRVNKNVTSSETMTSVSIERTPYVPNTNLSSQSSKITETASEKTSRKATSDALIPQHTTTLEESGSKLGNDYQTTREFGDSEAKNDIGDVSDEQADINAARVALSIPPDIPSNSLEFPANSSSSATANLASGENQMDERHTNVNSLESLQTTHSSPANPYAPRSSVNSRTYASPYAPTNQKSKHSTPNPYAPNHEELNESSTNNIYAPKATIPRFNPNTDMQELSELDMFSYGGYKTEEQKQNEESLPPPQFEQEDTKDNEVQTSDQDQDSLVTETVESNSQPQSRFDPIAESDPALVQPFNPMAVPIIRPASNPNFKPFTPASASNAEEYYDDVVEDESDEEEKEQEDRIKREEAARKKRLEEEKEKEKEKKAKNHDKEKGNSGTWFGWLKKDTNEKKPIKAKLGHQNTFYYDDKLKRWVNKNSTEEEKQEIATPPPPPPVIKRKLPNKIEVKPRSGSIAGGAAARTAGVVTPLNPLTGQPMLPVEESNKKSSSISPTFGIPVNLSGKKANGLDDLISLAGGPTPAGGARRKKKANRGYVNVMNNA